MVNVKGGVSGGVPLTTDFQKPFIKIAIPFRVRNACALALGTGPGLLG
jgi:hypothetical protein